MTTEDKPKVIGDLCIWCDHNDHPPGVLWTVSRKVHPSGMQMPGTNIGTDYVYCSHCDAGKELKKQESLRELLIKK